MIFAIGLRTERLLYLGFFLILICALQVYFTATAAHFNAANTKTLDSLIGAIEVEERELGRLYLESTLPHQPDTDREKRVAKMREELSLPLAQKKQAPDGPTYRWKLHEILMSIPDWHVIDEQISSELDAKKSPVQILARLREIRQSKIQDRGTVLGIETPRLLTVQYGSADFRLSAQPLATALLVALYPLVFVWIGSFYITRQRELLGIRALRDYKAAFPHILNFVAVDFSVLNAQLGFSGSRKNALINIKISQIITTLLRGVFLFVTVAPLIFGLGYSTIEIYYLLDPPLVIVWIAGVSYFVLGVLSLSLVIQELMALRGKIFYE